MNSLKLFSQSFTRTIFIICSIIFFCGQEIVAQGWETFIGDINDNQNQKTSWQSYAIGDGNYLVYHSQYNFGTASIPSLNIVKINPYGEKVWVKQVSGGGIAGNGFTYNPFFPCGEDAFITGFGRTETIGSDYTNEYIIKFDSDGNTIWEHQVFSSENDRPTYLNSMINSPDGGIYFCASIGGATTGTKYYFGKLSCAGELEFFNELAFPVRHTLRDMHYIGDDLFVFGAQIYPISTGKFAYSKLDSQLGLTDTKIFSDISNSIVPIVTPANEIIFSNVDNEKINHIKTDLDGNIISDHLIYDGDELSSGSHIYNMGDGIITTGARLPIGQNGKLTGFAIKSGFDGEIIWTKFYDHRNLSHDFNGAINATGGGYILTGSTFESDRQGYVIKVDEQGNIYSNSIAGNVSQDLDATCDSTVLDIPTSNWLITAEKSGDTFIGSTDSSGNYFIPVDTGAYVITCHYPNEYWTSCDNDSMINLIDFDNQIEIDYSVSALVDCPLITIDGNTPFLRPCFERPSYFQYCNEGTVVAENARIEITLDSSISVSSSSIPWDSQVGNTYIYEVGDLAPLECGNFSMSLFLDCDAPLEDTYSIKAKAFPDTSCTPLDPQYSGAFVELSGICNDQEIIFTIKNVGDEPMDMSRPYIIVEDAVLGYSNQVQLLANESVDIPIPTNGSTYTLIANQVTNAPGNSNPMVVLEGCGTNGQGTYSTGFTNQFGLDDGNPSCDLDLVEARNSFDPNAKSAYPIGYENLHLIRPNTPLEYTIYFQNTGSDTAFTVVLRDTLDRWLDLTSFEVGASSHNYSYKFEENRTLKFTFNNINLPDSTTNQLGSNGFVSFKIKPLASTPLQTVIKNSAAIYFDFNDPIFTNETFHTLDENFIEIIIDKVTEVGETDAELLISPNPFVDQTTIQIKNHEANQYLLSVFDMQGRLVSQDIHSVPNIVFRKNSLAAGMYFYKIDSDNGLFASGRLLVH